jgi:hypothetical protein
VDLVKDGPDREVDRVNPRLLSEEKDLLFPGTSRRELLPVQVPTKLEKSMDLVDFPVRPNLSLKSDQLSFVGSLLVNIVLPWYLVPLYLCCLVRDCGM